MEEEATRSVLRKKDASLVRAVRAVKEGRAQALVSAGNSGAILVASTLIIGRIKGVLRPALGLFLPTQNSEIFCLDFGANTDCKAEFLEQFAYMGSLYVQMIKDIQKPRVGLLSNGHEPYKGSLEVKNAYKKLIDNKDLFFVGNIEARDVFIGQADVLVTDGFVGNIFLKGVQGAARLFLYWVKRESNRSFFSKLCGLCSWPILKRIKQDTDYQRVGGALLLGVNKPVIVAHGGAQPDAIYNAIVFAQETVQNRRIEQFNLLLAEALQKQKKITTTIKNTIQSALRWVQR